MWRSATNHGAPVASAGVSTSYSYSSAAGSMASRCISASSSRTCSGACSNAARSFGSSSAAAQHTRRRRLLAALPPYAAAAGSSSSGTGSGASLLPFLPRLLLLQGCAAAGSRRGLVTPCASEPSRAAAVTTSDPPAAKSAAKAGKSAAGGVSEPGAAAGAAPEPKKRVRYTPLHHNIEAFCEKVVPTDEERKVKQRVIEIVRAAVPRAFPESRRVSGMVSYCCCCDAGRCTRIGCRGGTSVGVRHGPWCALVLALLFWQTATPGQPGLLGALAASSRPMPAINGNEHMPYRTATAWY